MLVVTHDKVLVNSLAAQTGRLICGGDVVTTDPNGIGDVIISGNHESDSIHFAESTDPRLGLTAAGCVSVDQFRKGTLIVQSRNRCVIVRTPDALVYQPQNSRNLFAVKANTPTEVKAFFGVPPVKLQPLSEASVRTVSLSQILASRAPAEAQPKANATTFYRAEQVAAPARTLSPAELRSIETMRTRVPSNLKAITRP